MSPLSSLLAVNVTAAGTDYEWTTSPIACSRPRSDAMRGLVAWLAVCQEGMCAACGLPFNGETLNINHIVSQGTKDRGYVAGNIYLGHRVCNETDSEIYGRIVPIASLIRADLIPTDYPTRGTMLAYAASASNAKADRAAMRAAHILSK